MYFKGVLNSFRNKKILPVFLMELTFLIISGLLIYSYKRIVEIKQLAIGKNAAELQQILQSTSSELIEVAPYLSDEQTNVISNVQLAQSNVKLDQFI